MNTSSSLLKAFASVVASVVVTCAAWAQSGSIAVERALIYNQTDTGTVALQAQNPARLIWNIRGGSNNMTGWGPAFYKPGSGGVPQSGSSSATNTGTLNFSTSPNNYTDYLFYHSFASDADLSAFYATGAYGVVFQGSTPPTPSTFTSGLSFTGGAYPTVIPQVSAVNNGAAWTGGRLRISPQGITTLTLNSFPEYTSTTYGTVMTVGIYAAAGGVVQPASLVRYYVPALGVTDAPITEVTVDGSWLQPGVEYILDVQYGVFASLPAETSLNGADFQGLASYYRKSQVRLIAYPSSVASSSQSDFNNDGWEDLVVENQATGERRVWLMNGTTVSSSAALPTVAAGWHFAGTGDFNGDQKADLVVQNTATGERVVWLMNGTNVSSSVSLPTLPVAWQFAVVDDLNGDGKADIVLQNRVTGERVAWIMNGTSIDRSVGIPTLPVAWQLAALEDFNADGQKDMVLQNTATGDRIIWILGWASASQLNITQSIALPQASGGWRIAGAGRYTTDGLPNLVMQNTLTGERSLWSVNTDGSVATTTSLSTLGIAWSFAGSGNRAAAPALNDLTGDGKSDILVTDTGAGSRIIWAMNGSSIGSSIALPTLPAAWEFRGIADFNGDGMNDMLLQNSSTGDRIIWLMNGTSIGASVALPTLPPQWSFAAVTDVNRDGEPDIVLENTSTGDRVIWAMDRTSIYGSLGLPTLPTTWRITAGGMFTSDGKANLLLENNSTGDRLFWKLNGDGSIAASIGLPTFLGGWHFAGTGDFNQDSQTDILLQNLSTGDRVIWQMDYTDIEASLGLPALPTTWLLRD